MAPDTVVERPAVPARLARFLLPDLSGFLALITLAYCVFIYGRGGELFRDSDTGWHIMTGERILGSRVLPRTDPYSFSKAGEPWIDWEWGSDVVIGLADRIGGLRGVTALFGLTIAACTWMWCRLSFAAGGDFFLVALFAPPMITTASLHWLARPHVFSWLLLIGAVWYAERRPLRFGLKQFLTIAAATALWANLHASFFLAPAIALAYAVSHLLRPMIWPFDPTAEWKQARWFLLAAAASCLGSFLNPYGWRLHQHVISYLWNGDLTSRIAEFQSFNFHEPGAGQVALVLALAAVGSIFALNESRLAHFLISAGFVWAGLRSARILPLIAVAILPLANAAIADTLRRAAGARRSVRRALDHVFAYSEGLRRIDRRMHGVAFCAAGGLVVLLALGGLAVGFPANRFPVDAASAVANLPENARIASTDSFGGYLIYRFNGSRKVYFDGRSDFYGVEFMKDYSTLVSARPGWREVARRFAFTHALVPSDSPLRAVLEQAGWITLYQDKVAVLEARPDGT